MQNIAELYVHTVKDTESAMASKKVNIQKGYIQIWTMSGTTLLYIMVNLPRIGIIVTFITSVIFYFDRLPQSWCGVSTLYSLINKTPH